MGVFDFFFEGILDDTAYELKIEVENYLGGAEDAFADKLRDKHNGTVRELNAQLASLYKVLGRKLNPHEDEIVFVIEDDRLGDSTSCSIVYCDGEFAMITETPNCTDRITFVPLEIG